MQNISIPNLRERCIQIVHSLMETIRIVVFIVNNKLIFPVSSLIFAEKNPRYQVVAEKFQSKFCVHFRLCRRGCNCFPVKATTIYIIFTYIQQPFKDINFKKHPQQKKVQCNRRHFLHLDMHTCKVQVLVFKRLSSQAPSYSVQLFVLVEIT